SGPDSRIRAAAYGSRTTAPAPRGSAAGAVVLCAARPTRDDGGSGPGRERLRALRRRIRSHVRTREVRSAPEPLPSASIGGRPPDPQAREQIVLITHDTRCALDTVVDLVNTAPEDDTTPDGLADVAALEAFVRDHEVSEVGVLTEFDLAAVRKIRGRF